MDIFVIMTVRAVMANGRGETSGTFTMTAAVSGTWSRKVMYQKMLAHIGAPPNGAPAWQVVFFSAEPDMQEAAR